MQYVGIENILSPAQWLEKLAKKKLKAKDICLTFDDGLRCQFDVALPVLEKYKLTAFWFVYSSVFEGQIVKAEVYNFFASRSFSDIDEFYENFLSRCSHDILTELEGKAFLRYAKEKKAMFPFYSLNDLSYRFLRNEVFRPAEFEAIMDRMVREKGTTTQRLGQDLWMSNPHLKVLAAKGHQVGLHSYSHPFAIADLPAREQKAQYERNYEHLQRVCGRKPVSMSHPLNSYNAKTLKILRDLKIICGFRSNMTPAAKTINPTRLEFAREDATNILRELV